MDRRVKLVQLSEQLTEAIFEELGEKGFVQLEMTLADGTRLLGVDHRARPVCDEEIRAVEPFAVNETKTIFGDGSCKVTIVSGGSVSHMTVPDALCPPHVHR